MEGVKKNQSDRAADENGVWARHETAVFTPAPPDHVQLSKAKSFFINSLSAGGLC